VKVTLNQSGLVEKSGSGIPCFLSTKNSKTDHPRAKKGFLRKTGKG